MIPKIPTSRGKSSTSFSNAVAYVTNEDKQEEGDNYITNVLSLETASLEMSAVSSKNNRVDDPVLHFILSWPSDETPNKKDMFKAADYALTNLGFDTSKGGHQAVFSIHRDTDNLHVHIVANRVNPKTNLAVDLWQSKDKLHKICRELELKNDWKPSKGLWEIKEGEVVKSEKKKNKSNYVEDDIRSQIGHTFGDYVRDVGNSIELINAKTWKDFHEGLGKFNLKISRRGGGYVVTDKTDPDRYHAKGGVMGSKYKAASLNKRLGVFGESLSASDAYKVRYVDPRFKKSIYVQGEGRSRKERDPGLALKRKKGKDALYQRYKDEKSAFWKEHKKESSALWTVQKKKEKDRWSEHILKWRSYRKEVMSQTPKGKKRVLSSLIALDKAKDKVEIDLLRKEERERLKRNLASKASFPTWRSWVRAQAGEGDAVAVSVYRGLRYRSKENDNIITSKNTIKRLFEDGLSGSSIGNVYAVSESKSVSFWLDSYNFATDYGYKISVHDLDKEAIENSLRIAVEKWGKEIKVSGSKEFVEEANRISQSMNVSLTNNIRVHDKEKENFDEGKARERDTSNFKP